MLKKKMGIPPLSDAVTESGETEEALLDPTHAELLAQSLEEQLRPIIKDAVRDAVRDSARRLARDLRNRLDAEMSLMIREAVDGAVHHELNKPDKEAGQG